MPKSVLIADDNSTIRQLVSHLLTNQAFNFQIHEAVDGIDAIEKAVTLMPDLILLDLAMPKMNGLDAARQMRKLKIQTPIVLFTMHASQISASTATTFGVDAVILKSDVEALNRQIERFVSA